MALAWKAGWVNSPQGFESPILRQMMEHPYVDVTSNQARGQALVKVSDQNT
jgi:hypothetical protein